MYDTISVSWSLVVWKKTNAALIHDEMFFQYMRCSYKLGHVSLSCVIHPCMPSSTDQHMTDSTVRVEQSSHAMRKSEYKWLQEWMTLSGNEPL